MSSQQFADILLHHKRLLWWKSREDRDRDLMDIAADIEYSEQMYAVGLEMSR